MFQGLNSIIKMRSNDWLLDGRSACDIRRGFCFSSFVQPHVWEISNGKANWLWNKSFCLSQCGSGSLSRATAASFQILTSSPVMTTFPCHERWVSYGSGGGAFRFLRKAGNFTPYMLKSVMDSRAVHVRSVVNIVAVGDIFLQVLNFLLSL